MLRGTKLVCPHRAEKLFTRNKSCDIGTRKGLILGAYEGCEPGELVLTPTAERFDECVGGRLRSLLAGTRLKKGKAFAFANMTPDFHEVAVAGLGPEAAGYNQVEVLNECKENIRIASGVGARALQEKGVGEICVEAFTNAEAAAEGATLGIFKFQDFKDHTKRVKIPKLKLYDSPDELQWKIGRTKGDGQNVARKVEETPANLMTPSIFAQYAVELLCPCGVQVEAYTRDWLENKRFNGVLTMAKGSCEPPVLLEIQYCGLPKDMRPVILTGKGVTYDSGGLNLKKDRQNARKMKEWRADLAGGATILGIFKAVAVMSLPINLTGLIILHENLIGGMSAKPGDVVVALNGKTIRIESTDKEGRVALSDVLAYSKKYKPCLIVNIADLGTGLREGIGDLPSGVFTNSDEIWEELNKSGSETGDRFWRFPLWKTFKTRVTDYVGVDVNNVGKDEGGGPCLGAAFLMEFVPPVDFAHIDISGTGLIARTNLIPYIQKGTMSGRPTRSIIEFLYRLACPHTRCDDC